MDRGAWQATVHRVTESDMTKSHTYTHRGKKKKKEMLRTAYELFQLLCGYSIIQ